MTVMSETPALCAKSTFDQPLSAQSSAINRPLNLAVGVEAVFIANRRYAHPVRTVNNNRQQRSTMRTSTGVASPQMPTRPVFHADLGEYFVSLRDEKKWTQSKAAAIAKNRGLNALTRQVLLRLESGMTKWPTPEVLRDLSILYGQEYSALVEQVTRSTYFRDVHATIGPSVGASSVTPTGVKSASNASAGGTDETEARSIESKQAKELRKSLRKIAQITAAALGSNDAGGSVERTMVPKARARRRVVSRSA